MPLFDFKCRHCGERFEALLRPPEMPACPGCESQNLEQLPTLKFAIDSENTREASMKTARRAADKIRKDYTMAQREHEREHHH